MQLSTPTASFDSSPLATLLAPGGAAPSAPGTIPVAPFADFMPAMPPATSATDFSTNVPVSAGLIPDVATNVFQTPDFAAEFPTELAPEFGYPCSPQPPVSADMPVPPTARPFAADTFNAARPEARAAAALLAPAPLEPLSDVVAAEPLQADDDLPLADGRPADLRPRHRAARASDAKPLRPTDPVPTPENAAPLAQPLTPEVGLNFIPPASVQLCAPSDADSADAEVTSDFVGDVANDRGAIPRSFPADDQPVASNFARVNPENPSAVNLPQASAVPPATADRAVAALAQPTPGRVTPHRGPISAGSSITPAPAAVPPGMTPTTQVSEAPTPAIVAPTAGLAGRLPVDAASEFASSEVALELATVATPVESPRPVWSGYVAQTPSDRANVENVVAGQPMLRSRNLSMATGRGFRSDSVPTKTPSGAGESVTTALPTLASMLPPKSAIGPFVSPSAPVSGQGEKTAAVSVDSAAELISDFEASQLNFLTPAQQQVKAPVSELGIDVAKSQPAMPVATSNRRSNASTEAAPELAVPTALHDAAPTAPGFVAPTAAPAPAPVAPAEIKQPAPLPATPAEVSAAAHRAVDAVLASTDRFTPVTQSSVDLQLSVGDAPLSVRVEVRGGVVHATFRTDSPELRTALAQEWQAAGHQQSADQSLRLAPAVFTNADRSSGDAGSAFAGQNFSQARDQSARSAPEFFPAGAARSQLTAALTAEPATSPASPRRSNADSSARLHAFA